MSGRLEIWEELVCLLDGMYTICVIYGWIQKDERNPVVVKSLFIALSIYAEAINVKYVANLA